ncbi:aldo-keto reductase family 1 member C23-like protein [Nannospalax galili]|uniref:aldo-keto reductase family 1 member C23-like protein n=1 Tax=Nannospalax galili TaxID=1026970 RepID=UPI00111C594E|nr:aldo-keto reductase family 1 member C23-like protein [Nannospalax galili]
MEKYKDAGLAKSIRVSNFNRRQLEVILNKPGLKYEAVCNQGGSEFPCSLDDPVLASMTKIYKRTPALIALRFQIQHWVVVLAKRFTEKRIKENMQVLSRAVGVRTLRQEPTAGTLKKLLAGLLHKC